MSVFVGENSVQLTIGQRGLINANIGTDVLWEYKVIASVPPIAIFYPTAVIAQMVFVSTFEIVTFDVVRSLERPGSYRGRVQQPLLKKPQTRVRCGCILLQVYSCVKRRDLWHLTNACDERVTLWCTLE